MKLLSLFAKQYANKHGKSKSKSKSNQTTNLINQLKTIKNTTYQFTAIPLDINAPPDIVMSVAKNLSRYNEFSQGAFTAHINGDLTPNNIVKLKLYKDNSIYKYIPEIPATVFAANKINDTWVIGWRVKLPFGTGFAERIQELKPSGYYGTQSTINDKIPGFIGFFTNELMKKKIEKAFNDLNQGIKREAERIAYQQQGFVQVDDTHSHGGYMI